MSSGNTPPFTHSRASRATGQRGAKKLRSSEWFGAKGRPGIIHRSWLRAGGLPADVFNGRPVIGIANSASELTPCNMHLSRVAEAVKRGVWETGGLPLEFPTMSLGESLMRPTTMLYRNLMAMEVEELLRANPLDGVVLLSGCDKTTPAMVMAAISADLPSILVTGGPMLNGNWRGQDIGSGTHLWHIEPEVTSGQMSQDELMEFEGCMSRSNGHCMTMGTASTMACLTEAMGLQLPGSAAWPAADARRIATAHAAGRRIVDMVHEDLCPSDVVTTAAIDNAVVANAAIGGSTNAMIHLAAIAGRAGIPFDLDRVDKLTREIPTLVNLMPSGDYLMEDFCYAGGLPAVLNELGGQINGSAVTVTGQTVEENLTGARRWGEDVIRPLTNPLQPPGMGTAVLSGNLCPDGAVLKQSAASPHLLQHEGKALVFDAVEDYLAVHEDHDLPIDETTVIVVRNCGPRGYPGMPEVGNVPLPLKLVERGVRDLVRISDARMSGTGFGTVVLHISPESAIGGPLALVQNGDPIVLDVGHRELSLAIPDSELDRRRDAWRPRNGPALGGYVRLYVEHILQADRGCDFDFLVGKRGHEVPRHSH